MYKNPKIKKVSTVGRETSAEVPRGYEEPRSTNIQDGHRPVSFDPFRLYLDEIKRYPLLSREDERDLAIRYR
ncbi:MAG: sigma-70 factor domain-containing protein, partial [Syntrophobacteraceae bacterium]